MAENEELAEVAVGGGESMLVVGGVGVATVLRLETEEKSSSDSSSKISRTLRLNIRFFLGGSPDTSGKRLVKKFKSAAVVGSACWVFPLFSK